MIEDLLYELQGDRVFSKIDLRARYHQIMMVEEDIYKTIFKTHHGHYEFTVIPFDLTKALLLFKG